jgi:ketosteroid isomerase-like protein
MTAAMKTGEERMSDEAAVTQAVNALAKAMVAGDRAQMMALTAEQLSYGHSNGMVETKAQFVENIAGGNNTFSRIDLSDAAVAVAGDKAIARHIFSADAINKGQAMSPRIGVLQVWVKEGGGWKLFARQAFKLG